MAGLTACGSTFLLQLGRLQEYMVSPAVSEVVSVKHTETDCMHPGYISCGSFHAGWSVY